VNSFLHHLDEEAAGGVLARLGGVLAPGGALHLVDLVLPETPGPARLLARLDRGRWARPFAAWERLFGAHFTIVVRERFNLTLAGVTLWNMVYLEGRGTA
jgi:hypothetical protein